MRVLGRVPRGVIGSGIYYPIKTDFRVWLEFARILESERGAHAAMRALRLCYKNRAPKDPLEALGLLCEFFLATTKHRGGGQSRSSKKLISFSEDEGLIFASFYSEYGIDLSQCNMHWWRFLALLYALGPDCALARAAAVRAVKTSDIKNPQIRRRIIEQKRFYALDEFEDDNAADVLAAAFSIGEEAQ